MDDNEGGPDLVESGRVAEGRLRHRGGAAEDEPRGYNADHPRIDLLRYKSLTASKAFGTPTWLGTPAVLDKVWNAWRQVTPLSEWITAKVGAS